MSLHFRTATLFVLAHALLASVASAQDGNPLRGIMVSGGIATFAPRAVASGTPSSTSLLRGGTDGVSMVVLVSIPATGPGSSWMSPLPMCPHRASRRSDSW